MTDGAASGEDGLVPPKGADERQTLPPGTKIGPYEVTEHLAVGGMAHVYKVWHSGLHRHEAMKVPLTRLGHDPMFLKRFFQEARLAAKLQHPNIVGIYSVSEAFGESATATADGTISYFTMELVDGTDLDRLLGDHGHLPLDQAIPILRGIADALDYAHARGVIHRDMKPSNVLLQKVPDGSGGYIAKVSDFGIARAAAVGEDTDGSGIMMRQTRLTKVGAILGTPAYMSPEQAEGGTSIVPASDQYALGIIAYELLCGHTPFPWNPESPMSVILSHLRDVPPPISGVGAGPVDAAINAVLHRALGKLASQRFPNCRAFVDALEFAGHATPIYGTPVGTPAGTPVGVGGPYSADPQPNQPNQPQQPLQPQPSFGGSGSLVLGGGGRPATSAEQLDRRRGGNAGLWTGVSIGAVAVAAAGAMLLTHRGQPTDTTPSPAASTKAGPAAHHSTAVVPVSTDDGKAAQADTLIAKASEQLGTINVQFRELSARAARHQLSAKAAKAARDRLVPMAKQALQETTTALAIDPTNHDAMELRIDALIYLGRNIEAKKRCKEALAVYPGDGGLKQRLDYVKSSGDS